MMLRMGTTSWTHSHANRSFFFFSETPHSCFMLVKRKWLYIWENDVWPLKENPASLVCSPCHPSCPIPFSQLFSDWTPTKNSFIFSLLSIVCLLIVFSQPNFMLFQTVSEAVLNLCPRWVVRMCLSSAAFVAFGRLDLALSTTVPVSLNLFFNLSIVRRWTSKWIATAPTDNALSIPMASHLSLLVMRWYCILNKIWIV